MNKIILFSFLSYTWEQFCLGNMSRQAIRYVSVMDFGLNADPRREKKPSIFICVSHICNLIHFSAFWSTWNILFTLSSHDLRVNVHIFCISLCQSPCLLETLAGFQAKLVKSFGPLEWMFKLRVLVIKKKSTQKNKRHCAPEVNHLPEFKSSLHPTTFSCLQCKVSRMIRRGMF